MLRLGKLKSKLLSEHTMFILLILLINLRITTWFQGDNILSSGDFRLPYNAEAFTQKILYSWIEVDYGLNSIYYSRILNPLYLLILIFKYLGLSLSMSELLAGYIVYVIASLSMYYIAYKITKSSLAAFYSTIFLISNVFLVNDREMLALGLIVSNLYVALPSIALLIKIIEDASTRLIHYLLYMLSLVPIFSAIPNYRPLIIYLVIVAIIVLYYGVKDGSIALEYIKSKYTEIKLVLRDTRILENMKLLLKVLLILSVMMIVVFIPLAPSLKYMLESYTEVSIPYFAIERFYVHDALRLIAKWSFYTITVLGKRLVPYSGPYLKNPFLVFLTYVPFLIVVLTILFAKPRKKVLYFGFWYTLLLFVLLLSKTGIYELLLGIPLLRAFRGPSNWLYLIVFLQSILIGLFIKHLTHSSLGRHIWLYSTTLGIVLSVIIVTAYPLYTGDIALNWVNPNVKGARFPEEYNVLDKYLDYRYWALLLPRRGSYVVYAFDGNPFNLGNPYPFMFSHPIITGLGLDYIKPTISINNIIEYLYSNVDKFSEYVDYYRLMSIGYVIIEKNIILGARYSKVDVSSLKLVIDNKYFSLYNVPGACSKLRSASVIKVYRDVDDIVSELAKTKSNKCSIVFVDTATYRRLVGILGKGYSSSRIISWRQYSPVYYEVNAYIDGYLIIVLTESYDRLWGIHVVKGEAKVVDHFKVNGGFNAWLIRGKGDIVLAISYGGQKYLEIFYAAITLILSSCMASLAYMVVSRLRYRLDVTRGVQEVNAE